MVEAQSLWDGGEGEAESILWKGSALLLREGGHSVFAVPQPLLCFVTLCQELHIEGSGDPPGGLGFVGSMLSELPVLLSSHPYGLALPGENHSQKFHKENHVPLAIFGSIFALFSSALYSVLFLRNWIRNIREG